MMRGVVLAGGTGSRLGKATELINKHCLPVYNRLMIEWAIKVLHDNKIEDIIIVSSPAGLKQIKWVMGDKYSYREQEKPGGIAQALMCADVGSAEPVAVILGDNLFLPSPVIPKNPAGAHCFLYRVSNQRELMQLGVADIDRYGSIRKIVEKPKLPPSKYAVTGLYAFDANIFSMLKKIKPSERGELEMTDALNDYQRRGNLSHTEVGGYWGDAGTPDGLLMCSFEAKDEAAWAMKY